MSKVKNLLTGDRIYQSLEQWKIDYLPNTVKEEHLILIKNQNPSKTSNDQINVKNQKESINLARLCN